MKRAPARAIQELAGHADLSATQRDMHLSPAATSAFAATRLRRDSLRLDVTTLQKRTSAASEPRDAPSLLRSYGAQDGAGIEGPPRVSV